MNEATERDLRNQGGRVLDRVLAGEQDPTRFRADVDAIIDPSL